MSGVGVADDILRAGYERWLRLEEEKAAIGDDLKELFAELKGQGFTPKALRESFRRVRNIDDANQQEHDAIVDLYVTSLTRARPAHTRGAAAEIDRRETFIEQSGGIGAALSEVLGVEVEMVPVHDPETGEVHDEPATEPQRPSAAQATASEAPPADEAVAHNPVQDARAMTANAVATAELEPAQEAQILRPGPDCDHEATDKSAGEQSSAAPDADELTQARIARTLKLRPNCQRPERCGSGIANQHCYKCSEAARLKGGAA